MQTTRFSEKISDHVWRTKYQCSEGGHMQEPSIDATWDRVALAVSVAEAHHHNEWRERFRAILSDFRFFPGGRVLARAGTSRRATLFNCFVMGPIEDSIQGIFNALREAMVILQAGAGAGVDFYTLRPAGSLAVASGGLASGPVSFMSVWEEANTVLESNKLRCGGEVCERVWSGGIVPKLCLVHRRMPARALWVRLLEAEDASAEAGVLFIDQINRTNNLCYCEQLAATNPRGEIPLPPYGACNLGSINLTRFVQLPFAEHPSVDFGGLRAVSGVATRFLDNVHDISMFPLKAQENAARACRRIGLGITRLADMLAILGLRYGSQASLDLTREIMCTIRDTAYRSSIEIAREKGAFPEFDKIKCGASPFVLDLPHDIRDAIAQHGIRNSHLLAVAPTGSISLLANNVSSGIEAVFAFKAMRRVRRADGQAVSFEVEDAAWHQYKKLHGLQASLPAHFVEAVDVSAEDQLRMMMTVQPCVDNAISRTVRLRQATHAQELGVVLHRAWELGLKGYAVCRECSRGWSGGDRAPLDKNGPVKSRSEAMDRVSLFDK